MNEQLGLATDIERAKFNMFWAMECYERAETSRRIADMQDTYHWQLFYQQKAKANEHRADEYNREAERFFSRC